MKAPIVQQASLVTVELPNISADFQVLDFSGTETLSLPYEFELQLASYDTHLSAADLLGQTVTIHLQPEISAPGRYLHGLVSEFSRSDDVYKATKYAHYKIKVCPPLNFLRYSSDCRIFKDQTVPEIVQTLLTEQGLSVGNWQGVQERYPKRN